ncbi:hypothetical protein [Nocardia sp. NPDC056100]
MFGLLLSGSLVVVVRAQPGTDGNHHPSGGEQNSDKSHHDNGYLAG